MRQKAIGDTNYVARKYGGASPYKGTFRPKDNV